MSLVLLFVPTATTGTGAGSSDGSSVVSGVGASTAASVGSSSGVATVSGVGDMGSSGVGSSTGTSVVTGVGASKSSQDGSAAGTSTATAVSVTSYVPSGGRVISSWKYGDNRKRILEEDKQILEYIKGNMDAFMKGK